MLDNVLKTIDAFRAGGAGHHGGRLQRNRDKTKRPVMARVAAQWSDRVFLTSDNPGTKSQEPSSMTCAQALTPLMQKCIAWPATVAKPSAWPPLAGEGDIVLVAGKGHETYQEIKGVRHDFDDREELLNAFNPA